MIKKIQEISLIENFRPAMGGVFSTNDLSSLFGQENPVLLYRRLSILEDAGILSRFSRGFYVTKGYNPEILCSRMNPESYLSLGTALSKHLIIGSIPATTLYAVKTGRNRMYRSDQLTLMYMSVHERHFFGYQTEKGIRTATAEKALLDTLFFHQRGHRFSFNIYEDIDTSRLDRALMLDWLSCYQNPRFISFVRNYLHERS